MRPFALSPIDEVIPMSRVPDLHRVPLLLRLLTPAAALAAFLSLPALMQGGSRLLALPVFAAGLFCVPLTLFGRGAAEVARG